MPGAEEPRDDTGADPAPSTHSISVAILAALAFVPIVVAAGFLTEHPATLAVPADISVLALRGAIDGEAAARPPTPSRAGY